jgi:hypothetical protein
VKVIPGWNKSVPLSDWDGGWYGGAHIVEFDTEVGKQTPSFELACAIDDIATDLFAYRDFTVDGLLPFARAGETYRSKFLFRSAADCEKFRALLEADRKAK